MIELVIVAAAPDATLKRVSVLSDTVAVPLRTISPKTVLEATVTWVAEVLTPPTALHWIVSGPIPFCWIPEPSVAKRFERTTVNARGPEDRFAVRLRADTSVRDTEPNWLST